MKYVYHYSITTDKYRFSGLVTTSAPINDAKSYDDVQKHLINISSGILEEGFTFQSFNFLHKIYGKN